MKQQRGTGTPLLRLCQMHDEAGEEMRPKKQTYNFQPFLLLTSSPLARAASSMEVRVQARHKNARVKNTNATM